MSGGEGAIGELKLSRDMKFPYLLASS